MTASLCEGKNNFPVRSIINLIILSTIQCLIIKISKILKSFVNHYKFQNEKFSRYRIVPQHPLSKGSSFHADCLKFNMSFHVKGEPKGSKTKRGYQSTAGVAQFPCSYGWTRWLHHAMANCHISAKIIEISRRMFPCGFCWRVGLLTATHKYDVGLFLF